MKNLKYSIDRLRADSPGAALYHVCYPGINISRIFFHFRMSPGLNSELSGHPSSDRSLSLRM